MDTKTRHRKHPSAFVFAGGDIGKMCDKRIVARQRIAMGGQAIERGGHVEDFVPAHEPEAVVGKSAQAHGISRRMASSEW